MSGLSPGSTLGPYRIDRLLGRGGMGVVYRARALEGGPRVALKVIAADLAFDPQFRARFHREAAAAASFEHAHVVPVLQAGEHEGLLYLAMQFVDGVDLGTLIDRHRLLPAEVSVRIVGQVASALDAAHAIGLVHRDVKPANILVASADAEPHAYLADFGVARRLQDATRLTRPGMVLGTLDYLAPEALRGEGSGPAVDIYALGCVLYEMLAGEVPLRRDNDVAILLAHLNDAPPPLASRVPGTPRGLERVVERALAKDPADRFASPSAFARAARAALTADDPGAEPTPVAHAEIGDGATAPVVTTPPPRATGATPIRKRVTLLYALPGSLQPSSDPEIRLAATARLARVVRPVLERHGGMIEAAPTEGVIAVFGLPTLHEDDAARAVRAALALRAELEAPPDAAITAIATGVVVAGGDTPPATTLGALVQRASRMLQAAAPGEILVCDATRGLTDEHAWFEATETGHDMQLWRLSGMRSDSPVDQHVPPFVGRNEELAQLRRALADVTELRSSCLVSIVGQPGVGKTRLASAFAAAVGADATIGMTRCRPKGEADAQQPVRDLLAGLLSSEGAADPREFLDADDAEAIAERVERLLGVREGSVPADEVPWVARRFLSAVASNRPLVALFEDIHWADAPLLELIEHLAEWTHEAQLLLVCLTRPELIDRRPDWGYVARDGRRILLEPLSETESLALVDRLPALPELSDAARARLVQAAEGNPLFLEQMVALIRDRPERGDAITVPPGIHSLLAARIDQLSDPERSTIAHASVIGREFSQEPLRCLLGDGRSRSLAGALRSLARKQLIEPLAEGTGSQGPWRFGHALIRDAAYDSLPLLARAELHEQHAAFLSRDGSSSDEALGYQLEQAYRYRSSLTPSDPGNESLGQRAGANLLQAGRRAFGRDDAEVAASLLERAVALPFNEASERLAVLPMLGEAYANAGAYERAKAVLERAIEEGRRTADRGLEANALVQQVWVQMAVGDADFSTLLARAREARAWLSEVGHEHGLAEAHLEVAELLRAQGRIAEAERELDRALRHAASADDDRQTTRILWLANGCRLDGPAHVADLEEHAAYCLRWARERNRGSTPEASALRAIAWAHAVGGEFDRARDLLAEAKAILEDRGLRWFLAAFGMYVAEIELLADGTDVAEQALRRSYSMCEVLGDTAGLCSVAASLAHVLIRQGRLHEALALTEASESIAVADDIDAQVRWRTARAHTMAHEAPEPAFELAAAAVAIVDGTDAVPLRAHAYESLAAVLERLERHSAALNAGRTAHELYAAKGYQVQAANVAALLRRVKLARSTAGRK